MSLSIPPELPWIYDRNLMILTASKLNSPKRRIDPNEDLTTTQRFPKSMYS